MAEVEVVYADERGQIRCTVRGEGPFSVAQALAGAARDADWSRIDLASAQVGVFGKRVSRERILRDGERLEVYAALKIDPKTARRNRAKAAR